MIRVNNLSIQFTGRFLFDNVSFTIADQNKIGLIGRNGTGKTTLLKILAREQIPESGNVSVKKDFTIGYLPQEGCKLTNRPLKEEAAQALTELKEIEEKIDEINIQLARRTDYESKGYHDLIIDLNHANERYDYLEGGSVESEIEKVLKGLGFTTEEFDKPVSEFSGGWQMRIELAKILLRKPNCILLDEPTNHLDIESLLWLEWYLKNYKGAIVIVSHDRKFLDSITNRTIEISLGKIFDQGLAYTKFMELRNQQKEQQKAARANQQKKIAQTERFIERFRSKNTLATRVQSKIRQLEKMERIEVDGDDLTAIKFRFPDAPRSGVIAVETSNLTKSYGDNLVLSNVNLTIERGEKIAFIGKNGEGKSTLSRIIAGVEDYEGELKIGHNVEIGFYAQKNVQFLNANQNVFEVIDNAATGDMRSRVRSLLGAFLFSGDSIYKKVKVLSGGEQSRLALARLLLNPVNLLILDEPTNHLDMVAKDVLKQALAAFNGSLIIVSHDRAFLEGLTAKTIEFKNHNIREYPGDINDFLRIQKIETLQALEKSKSKGNNRSLKSAKPSHAKQSREARKKYQTEKNRLGKNIIRLEKEIESAESRIVELDKMFEMPDFHRNMERASKMHKEYGRVKAGLEDTIEEWTEFHRQLEKIESEYNA